MSMSMSISTFHSQPHFSFLFSPTKQVGLKQSLVLKTRQIGRQKVNSISSHHHALLVLTTTKIKHPDISVFLLTGSALLLLYWVANFLVPGIIEKDFQSDKGNEVTNDEETISPENGSSTVERSLGTKRGFGGTKK
ncbi:uncharacterized protein LOC124940507 [Impatiens glandulifera]|uniref:uncharacterized protein LOC124940507 n=1 Tax=Impatiens glandulifera TaxID=253017 RepID=UPI001FB12404|nr:uncharacterized protein LOC124940507 [Impatiens glandulifera]